MLIMNSKFVGLPVASIQAGFPIAQVKDFIINPHKLHIVAFYVEKPDQDEDFVLFVDDITDMSRRGLVIDHDDLIMKNEDDLVRLKEITDLDFYLISKPVETESGAKVGTVSRFALDPKSFMIMQLYVTQPMTLNFNNAEVLIHRDQIVNVTDKKVVVQDTAVKVTAKFGFRGLLFGRQSTAEAESERADSRES